MKNHPGYPLPDGELGEDEIVCQLVYLPNRDEYWRALFSAVHFMSTWIAWERDDDHRGKDAAKNWREAFELTVECWRMTCLTDITDRMDDIINLINLKKDCCDSNMTYGPGVQVETEIEPDVGDPPDYYGETAVTDWDDWKEHVCHNAHVWVDSLVWQAGEMDDLLQLGGVGIGALGAALLLLSAVGLVIAIPFGVAAATAAGIFAAGTLAVFLTTADDIEDAREDIVCALLQGGSVADVIEGALGSVSLDWLLFFSQIPYDSVTAIIYEGGYEEQYLPPELRDDCTVCEFEQQGDEDLFIEWIYADNQSYDSGAKEWFANPVSTGGCFRVEFKIWTDDTKTTEQPCRIVVTGCDGDTTCGGAYHNIGLLHPTTIWEFDHPPFPDVEDAAIDRYVHIHEQPGIEYDLTFKLYV